MTLTGKVEHVDRGRIQGWLWDDAAPGRPLGLILTANGEAVGCTVALDERTCDPPGGGGGRTGFDVTLTPKLLPGLRYVVEVRRRSDGAHVDGSPWVLEAIGPNAFARGMFKSHLDLVTHTAVQGWAWDGAATVALVVSIDGAPLAQIAADRRHAAAAALTGTGHAGFALELSPPPGDDVARTVEVRRASDGLHVEGSPRTLTAREAPAEPRTVPARARAGPETGPGVTTSAAARTFAASNTAAEAGIAFGAGSPTGPTPPPVKVEAAAQSGARAVAGTMLGVGSGASAEPAAPPRAVGLRGKAELVSQHRIKGWAWSPDRPTVPVSLIVSANGAMIGRVLANQHRKDLAALGYGDGRCSFDLHLSPPLSPTERYVVEVRRESDGAHLAASPYVLEPATAFDAVSQSFIGQILLSVGSAEDVERRLVFLAKQASLLRQTYAERFSGAQNVKLKRRLAWQEPTSDVTAGDAPSRPRALVIDKVAPTPNHDAGSNAVMSHMRALQRLGYDVTFAPLRLKVETDMLEAEGILCCRRPWYETIEEVLVRQSNAFAVVYLHRVATAGLYMPLVRHYQLKARVVYNLADLNFLRLARQAEVEHLPELRIESQRARRVELSAAGAADAVITHSRFEAEILRRNIAPAKVHVVPWSIPVRPVRMPFANRSGLAFIGGYGHRPNVDAAVWLIETAMPEIAKLDPTLRCLIVGSGMPDSLRRLAGAAVETVGHVEALSDVFERVRLTVAPLAYGAGAKGKVLDSLAAGVPCICSPAAAEGLDLPQILLDQVASAPADLARKIKQLHDDEDLNRACAAAGLSYMEATASEAHVDALMRRVLELRG